MEDTYNCIIIVIIEIMENHVTTCKNVLYDVAQFAQIVAQNSHYLTDKSAPEICHVSSCRSTSNELRGPIISYINLSFDCHSKYLYCCSEKV